MDAIHIIVHEGILIWICPLRALRLYMWVCACVCVSLAKSLVSSLLSLWFSWFSNQGKIYIRWHSHFSMSSSESFDKSTQLCNDHNDQDIEQIRHSQKPPILCARTVNLSSHIRKTYLLSVSILLPFPECRIHENAQRVSFWVCLLSLDLIR